jgi:hypothetical protein
MTKKTFEESMKGIKKGAFTAKAEKAGGVAKDGKIKESFIKKEEKSSNPKTKKEAVLAQTFKNMKKGK